MARQGVQEQAVRHNDPAAPYGELIACLGLSAAVLSLVSKGRDGKGVLLQFEL